MINICEAGEIYSINEADKKYYTQLKDKLYDVLDLLEREPVIENQHQ